MKLPKARILIMALALTTLLLLPACAAVRETPYAFPVVPGTAQWAELGSLEEKLAVSQIPEEILERLTTEALIRTVMGYPLGASLFVHDTVDDPFRSYDIVKEEFNGLAELDRRLREDPEAVLMALDSVMRGMPAPSSEDTDEFDVLYMERLAAMLWRIYEP